MSGDDGGSGGGGGGNGGSVTAAAAAPGVTVDTSVGTDAPGQPPPPLLRRSNGDVDTVGDRGGGDNAGDDAGGDAGGDGGVRGASSWHDAWEIDGSAPHGGGGEGTPSGVQVGGAAARSEVIGGSSGSSGAEQAGEAGGGQEARVRPEKKLNESRPGDERAHKMWVTGGGAGDSVSGKTSGRWWRRGLGC